MSLVFAALVPHPPMLLPSIGREHAKKLDKTWQSYLTLKTNLAAAAPDTIVIISPHQPVMPETFAVNCAPQFMTHFLEFGDFSEPKKFKTDFQLVERLRHDSRIAGNRINLVSDDHLDYGSGVPLYFLPTDPAPNVVPVAPTLANAKTHFSFGQTMKEVLLHSKHRVALICSGDLSHRHASDSPSGFSPKAKEFDEMITANLSAGSASPILQMDETFVADAHACGYRPICMLLGVLDRMEYRSELLSYESPFGIGYAAMQFHLT